MENNSIQIINNELIDHSSILTEEVKEEVKDEVTEEVKEEVTEEVGEDKESIVIDYDTLVLAGGSSKGLMILGALQYGFDNYLLKNVNTYIGCSAGAMIGYLLAIGYTPIEIVVYICCNQLMEKMVHFNIVAMINKRRHQG